MFVLPLLALSLTVSSLWIDKTECTKSGGAYAIKRVLGVDLGSCECSRDSISLKNSQGYTYRCAKGDTCPPHWMKEYGHKNLKFHCTRCTQGQGLQPFKDIHDGQIVLKCAKCPLKAHVKRKEKGTDTEGGEGLEYHQNWCDSGCKAGTFWVPAHTEPVTIPKPKSPKTKKVLAACQECDETSISGPGSYGCSVCPLGSKPNADKTACVLCPAGSFGVAPGTCSICDDGEYADTEGSLKCKMCDSDTGKNSNADFTGCLPECVIDGETVTDATRCKVCDRGMYNQDGKCLRCENPGHSTVPGHQWASRTKGTYTDLYRNRCKCMPGYAGGLPDDKGFLVGYSLPGSGSCDTCTGDKTHRSSGDSAMWC